MHVDLPGLVLVGIAMFVGALVQGTIGFGAVIVAFAVVVMVEPALLPQAIIVGTLPMTIVVFLHNRANANWPEVVNLALSRIPGVALGAIVVKLVSPTALAYIGAGFILVAVAATAAAPPIPRRVPLLSLAGVVSGFFGSTVGIGGPPLGLLYQNESGGDLRATVGTVGLTGVATTTVGLWLAGELSATDVRTGLALMPFGLAGALSVHHVARWADRRVRPIVQAVSVLGALLAIARLAL